MDTQRFTIFKAIVDFINDLDIVFGKQYKTVALYKRLVVKTTIIHEIPVNKHINTFKEFLENNIEALETKNNSKILSPIIKYSDRVFINIQTLLSKSDNETASAIWNHLLNINTLINPSEKSLVLFKESINSQSENDEDFIQDIINTVTDSIDPNSVSDPMSAAMSLINSGKLTNIMSSMTEKFTNGTLNPEQMLKKVTQMYTNVTQGHTDAPDINSIISSLNK